MRVEERRGDARETGTDSRIKQITVKMTGDKEETSAMEMVRSERGQRAECTIRCAVTRA